MRPSAKPKPRFLPAAAIVALLPALSGCHIGISTEVVYTSRTAPRATGPGPGSGTAPEARKRNELVAGLLKPKLVGPAGAELDPEAGDEKDLGRALADAIEDLRIFKELRYPLRDEAVDVILEPTFTVALAKHRLTNALKVFPGLVLPYIDGFGLDYDHDVLLEVVVREGKGREACDRRRSAAGMTAERYPSVLWFIGLHVGLLILLVFESATTDSAVVGRLVERNAGLAIADSADWLAREFSPGAKACVDHPDVPQTGRYCVYCRRDLWYQILNRREGAARAPGDGAPPPPR